MDVLTLLWRQRVLRVLCLPRLLIGLQVAASWLCPHIVFPLWMHAPGISRVSPNFFLKWYQIGLGPNLTASFNLITPFKSPIFKNSHILTFWALELQRTIFFFLGGGGCHNSVYKCYLSQFDFNTAFQPQHSQLAYILFRLPLFLQSPVNTTFPFGMCSLHWNTVRWEEMV